MLQWILANKFKVHSVLHMVDDFLILGTTQSQAKAGLDIFQQLCQFLGVPLIKDKTFSPERRLPFLGVDFAFRPMNCICS